MSNTPEDNESSDSDNESSDSDNESSDSDKNHWNIEGYYVVWKDVKIENDKNETKSKPTCYICCTNIFDGTLCEILLAQNEGLCPSGWTTATWGVMKIYIVSAFKKELEYVPINRPARIEININYEYDYKDEFKCPWFEYERYGLDDYYPSGGYYIIHENFKKESKN